MLIHCYKNVDISFALKTKGQLLQVTNFSIYRDLELIL